MYLYGNNFIVFTCEILKKKKLNVYQNKITVEDLCQNVLSKKMCFHFHDYTIYIRIISVFATLNGILLALSQ